MIYTYPNCRTVLLADLQKRDHFGPDLFQLLSILLVAIFQHGKGFLLVDKVTRVDPHFLRYCGRHMCRTRIEMDICRQRRGISLLSQLSVDVPQILSLPYTLCSEPDQIGARCNNPLALSHATFGIERVCVCHCLYNNRVVTSQGNVSDTHIDCWTAMIIEIIHSYFLYIKGIEPAPVISGGFRPSSRQDPQ